MNNKEKLEEHCRDLVEAGLLIFEKKIDAELSDEDRSKLKIAFRRFYLRGFKEGFEISFKETKKMYS